MTQSRSDGFFRPESDAEKLARLEREMPKAQAAYQAERVAIDARTAKLRELRLAKEMIDGAAGVNPKKQNREAIGEAVRRLASRKRP